MSFLGLDLGEKRIGVAVSDELNVMAHGIGFIARKNDEQAFREIEAFIIEFKAQTVVVGLPITLKGQEGVQAGKVHAFVEGLKKRMNCSIATWDERFTTAQAERTLIEQDMSRAKRREKRDALAAEIMLQSYLDHQKMGKG